MNKLRNDSRFISLIHWITFVLLIFVAISGVNIFLDVDRISIGVIIHLIIGSLIFCLTFIRVLSLRKTQIKRINNISLFHQKIINIVHFLIYALLFIIPITGVATLLNQGQISEVPLLFHQLLFLLLCMLIVIHIVGVVKQLLSTKALFD
ncbi:cytochrome b/b6 domain-containing protein [Halosquirtibacter xylanolyticus]|uniref:cytochrome b/b6 domain-containing protein n=1 Tax=Halosquirtibacter xylanolyticus TaxID=3374599 RepID=UPI00374A8CEA|nr:cytochrome b/b6 domain-containing protein [Prolixibacteraceae bacterium]